MNAHTGDSRKIYLPLWVVMLKQFSLVSPGKNYQATILPINWLHGGPRADDPVGGSEWKVVEV